MLAEDIAPNRLEKAKRLVSALLNDLASDRVGIIAYAAQAVPQLPITTDYGRQKCFYKPSIPICFHHKVLPSMQPLIYLQLISMMKNKPIGSIYSF